MLVFDLVPTTGLLILGNDKCSIKERFVLAHELFKESVKLYNLRPTVTNPQEYRDIFYSAVDRLENNLNNIYVEAVLKRLAQDIIKRTEECHWDPRIMMKVIAPPSSYFPLAQATMDLDTTVNRLSFRPKQMDSLAETIDENPCNTTLDSLDDHVTAERAIHHRLKL